MLMVLARGRPLALVASLALATVAMAACAGDDAPTAGTAKQSAAVASRAAIVLASPVSAGNANSLAVATAEIKMLTGPKFDKARLSVPANNSVTLTADNTDSGVQHRFALFKDEADAVAAAPLASTQVCKGPCTETVVFNLVAGDYYFQCQIHPSLMHGMLAVR